MGQSKGRHIPILQFFEELQLEYLLYELRVKIFPSKRDKDNYKDVLDYKRDKIENISSKNDLSNIFNSESKLEEITEKFYNDFGIPKNMSKRDKYFYYFIGSDFSYRGEGVKLLSYDLSVGTVDVGINGENKTVDINEVKRIL